MKLYKIRNEKIKKSAHLFLLKKKPLPSPYSTANPLLTCASFPSKEKMNSRRCQKVIEDDLRVQKVGGGLHIGNSGPWPYSGLNTGL